MHKSIESPPNIMSNQIKYPREPKRKFADAQIVIQKYCVYLNAVQQIIHVIGKLHQLSNFSLVLRIDAAQLFIDTSQFFVG